MYDLTGAQSVAKSPIEQIQELDAQREEILSEAKTNALTRAEEAVSELNALGFHYYIGETEKNVRRAMRRPKQLPGVERRGRAKHASLDKSALHKPSSDKPCPICNFQTDPPHDKRSHRNYPRAFTERQLAEWGMTRL
jgi:hypothetical protein